MFSIHHLCHKLTSRGSYYPSLIKNGFILDLFNYILLSKVGIFCTLFLQTKVAYFHQINKKKTVRCDRETERYEIFPTRVHGSAYALPTFEFKCQCHLSSRCRATRELCLTYASLSYVWQRPRGYFGKTRHLKLVKYYLLSTGLNVKGLN